MKHAKLSASGSPGWLGCPGSVSAQEQYPDTGSSIYALEGTRAHELADKCLKTNKEAVSFVGKKIMGEKIEKDMARYVQQYLDYVSSHESTTTDLYTEERVDFSNIVPGGFGTLDAAVVDSDTGICHIFDLKYGRGVQVYSKDNTQAQLYCLGMLNEYGWLGVITRFRIHIVQPRKVTPDPWDISVEDLEKFGQYATQQANIALAPGAPRVPGEKQCQWCRAKGDCEQLASFVEETISAEFDDLDDVTVPGISDARKKAIIDNKKFIEDFLNAVEDSVFSDMLNGGEFEGYKLVEGRSNRQWTEDAEAVLKSALKSKAYNTKLIGIGAAEKLLGKDELEAITHKPEGKPTLARDSDRRVAISTDVTKDFDKI